MSKKITFFGLIFLISASMFLSACTKPESKTAQPAEVTVAATIFPLYDILRQVGGDKVEAILLLPPGTSPHTFEVSPEQVKKMQTADFLLTIGADIDNWALALAANAKEAKVLSLDEVVELRPAAHEEGEHEEEGHEEDIAVDGAAEGVEHVHGEFDPHYWLDPNNARLMAVYIATMLGEFNPENADYYQAQAQQFAESLASKEPEWQNQLQTVKSRDLLVFHEAWNYFASHFNLNIIASVEPFPGQSPSPQYLENLQTQIVSEKVQAIFIEPQLSASVASALANDLNIKIATLDPIGGVSGRESYQALIDYNVATIVNTLGN